MRRGRRLGCECAKKENVTHQIPDLKRFRARNDTINEKRRNFSSNHTAAINRGVQTYVFKVLGNSKNSEGCSLGHPHEQTFRVSFRVHHVPTPKSIVVNMDLKGLRNFFVALSVIEILLLCTASSKYQMTKVQIGLLHLLCGPIIPAPKISPAHRALVPTIDFVSILQFQFRRRQ